MKFYTKTGDTGRSLSKPKYYKIFHVLGEIDLIQGHIGIIRSKFYEDNVHSEIELWNDLKEIQHELFTIQSIVFNSKFENKIKDIHINKLEDLIDNKYALNKDITNFVIASGSSVVSAQFDVLRALTRRAERFMWEYIDSENQKYLEICGKYLNRLSTLFYVLARQFDNNQEIVKYTED